jgi:catechol 2,3-dioxygenase-like lactoylglutathione lyase family enzyme
MANSGFTVHGMHHFAYKCKDPLQTRHFYEEVLGMPLEHIVRATHIPSTGGEPVHYFHMFFRMANGSYIAFFDLGDDEAALPSPNTDLWINHIALEVGSLGELEAIKQRLQSAGVANIVGPLDHDFIKSIYLFDPNGIRLEFTVRTPQSDHHVYGETATAQAEFEKWLAERSRAKEFARTWKIAERQ